jgi:hypothetical protein
VTKQQSATSSAEAGDKEGLHEKSGYALFSGQPLHREEDEQETFVQSLMKRLCTKTTHVSEWMINYNLLQRLPRTYESHQHELVDRSFRLEEAAIEESTN